MRRPASLLLLSTLAAIVAGPGGAAQNAGGTAPATTSPLFDSHEPLRIRIEADFGQLEDDRGQESEERDGRFFLVADDGTETELPLKVRTRGNFRLQRSTCRFPPLRLNFPKRALEGTILDGEDKLKMVTHCRDDDRFEQMVVKEYLIYRAYNLLTDASFRVRLARVAYTDVENGPLVERLGFLIEDDDLLAERLGGSKLEVEEISPRRIAGVHEGLLALFQYMVGNTDFSIFFAHNTELVQDGDGFVLPVPYDFDWSGIVDAPYARPDESIGTSHVRERVYRGLCRADVSYPALYRTFLDAREEILTLFRTEEALTEEERARTVDYLNDFFATIEDPDRAARRIEADCLPTS